MEINLASLQAIVNDWYADQPTIPDGMVLTISITPAAATVDLKRKKPILLNELLVRETFETVEQGANAARVINAIRWSIQHEFRGVLDWETVTVDDFLQQVPDKSAYWLRVRNSGEKSFTALNAVLGHFGYRKYT